jgi:hypothetical protein
MYLFNISAFSDGRQKRVTHEYDFHKFLKIKSFFSLCQITIDTAEALWYSSMVWEEAAAYPADTEGSAAFTLTKQKFCIFRFNEGFWSFLQRIR